MKINIFRSLFISTALFAFFFLSCKKEKEVIPPEILTYRISNLTYTTAEISGEVINNGGAEVIARGFCYAPLENPTFSDYTTSNGAGNGVFSSKLTGLNPGTKYYLRAYAINSVGIGYGNQINFTTVPLTLAMLTTETPTFITSNSAISGGNILNDGGSFIKERGVCWSEASNPTISDYKTINGSGNGSFVSKVINLSPHKIYYLKSYATNDAGTSYGGLVDFITSDTIPTVSTMEVTLVTNKSAVSGGSISSDGGSSIIAKGVCWNTESAPTINNQKTDEGPGSFNFTSQMTGLQVNTNYYVRAYATNNEGTSYGNEASFTTIILPPTVTTAEVTGETMETAICGGSILDDGGDLIIDKGVCWSTNIDPTINDNKTNDGIGSNAFSINLIELSASTLYYVRAYAANSAGTGYGDNVIFNTASENGILYNLKLNYGSVTDIDGNIYKTIKIRNQEWMADNLRTTKFNDGSNIPLVTDPEGWRYLSTPGYCWYNNDVSNKDVYGALYNGFAVEHGNICPTGWHVPSLNEIDSLTHVPFHENTWLILGPELKEKGITHWEHSLGATNESGFTAIPSGFRYYNDFPSINKVVFVGLGRYFRSWSSTTYEVDDSQLWHLALDIIYNTAYHPVADKSYGLNIRCIKD